MNRNMLRAPLIKSAALLAVVSLLVYLTATSAEGSFWSSLGTLFFAMIRMIQLGLGLIVALFFCMAVLTGIFLGCVTLFSRESGAKMAEQLRQEISNKLLFVRSLVVRDVPSRGERVLDEHGEGLKKDILATMAGSLEPIQQNYAATTEKIDVVIQRLERIEQGDDLESLVGRLESQEGRLQDFAAAADQVRYQIASIKQKIDELIGSPSEQKVDPAVAELGIRIDSLEKTVKSLVEELTSLRELSDTRKIVEQDDSQAVEKPVEHRLFAHIKNKAMQDKIEHLVTEALDKEMSHAQVNAHLVANTKGKTSKVIASHPSLVKDYVRYRRSKG